MGSSQFFNKSRDFLPVYFQIDVCFFFNHSGKLRRESFSEDFDEHSGTTFQATFGNRWYTWSFKSWEESFLRNSTNGFEWRDDSNWTNSRNRKWHNPSDIESNDESYAVGSASDRTILGLSTKGPLKIEDVKNA